MLDVSFSLTAALLFAIALLGLVVSCLVNYRKVPNVPGPFLASISPVWLIYNTIRGDVYLKLEEAFQRYGSPVRIAPDYIVVNDFDTIRSIFSPRGSFVRGRWFNAMGLGADRHNVMTLTNEKDHATHRSRLMPGYSGKETRFEPPVDKIITEMLGLIRKEYLSLNLVMDFARIASFFTLDVLTKVAFGLEIGFIRHNKDHYDYQRTLASFVPLMDLGCNSPTIFKILNSKLFMRFAKPRPEDKTGQGALIGRAHTAVGEYFSSSEKDDEDTMIASFKRHGVTQAQCEDETMLAILAGSDSTSTVLRTAFLSIVTNPHVYTKLNREIADAIERGAVSFPIITMAETQALPYLCAIVKEALRFFYPLHGLTSHYAETSVEIQGRTIPPRVQVGIAWYSMNRNSKVWGSDAKQFRPERWTEADDETRKKFERDLAVSFASGTSVCLGKNLALMELHKGIFELFRNFDFAITDPLKPITVKSHGIVLWDSIDVRVQGKKQL